MINNSAVIKRKGSQTLTTFVIVISVARRSVEYSTWMDGGGAGVFGVPSSSANLH